MKEKVMTKNYAKAFKTVIILAIVLALVSAISIPLCLAQQIRDISALEQSRQEQSIAQDGQQEGRHIDREKLWKSQLTPLGAANYALLGGVALLWLVLGLYYWLLVVAWLYKSAVNEGMNKSLWPILGLFTNLFGVFAFLIVRDNPRRIKAATAQ